MKHATECGGSNAYRYTHCIPAKKLIEKVGKKPSGEKAAIGTVLHGVVEHWLVDEVSPEDAIGHEFYCGDKLLTVTDEMIGDKVIPAIDFLDELLPNAKLWPEQQVYFPQKTMRGVWGTADILFNDPELGWGVLDWKFGEIPVGADSYQMQFYLAAARHLSWFGQCEQYTSIVIQPKDGVVEKKVHTFTAIDLDNFETKLEDAYDSHKKLENDLIAGRVAINDPSLYATGPQCQWCDAARICPKKRQEANDAVMGINTAFEALMKKQSMKKHTANYMDGIDIAQTYLDAVNAKKWCTQIIDYVKDEFANDRPIDGLKRIDAGATREWADEEKVKAFYGDECVTTEMKSVAEMGDVPDELIRKKPRHKVVRDDGDEVLNKIKSLL